MRETQMARQRARRGGGSIFEAYAGFYLRVLLYFSSEPKSLRLCGRTILNYSVKAKVVKELAAAKIAELR